MNTRRQFLKQAGAASAVIGGKSVADRSRPVAFPDFTMAKVLIHWWKP